MQTAAKLVEHKLVILKASAPNEIDEAFASAISQHVDALAVAAHAFFGGRSQQLADLSLQHRLPTISYSREFVAAGGLMSYGGSQREAFRLQGRYTARILKSEKPADLPVQQVIRFEMALNLKAAKSLDLTISPSLLAIADEVIE
jgi:putative ABC transport system substrate-binding protein